MYGDYVEIELCAVLSEVVCCAGRISAGWAWPILGGGLGMCSRVGLLVRQSPVGVAVKGR